MTPILFAACRSLLKSAPVKSSLFVASAPVYLDKADILPA